MKVQIWNTAREGTRHDVQIRCPECETMAAIDEDQFHGLVSVECATDRCTFHRTVNFAGLPTESPTVVSYYVDIGD